MATPPNLIQMTFAGGIDQSQRLEVLDPMTAFVRLENLRQNERGAVTKRFGFTALALTRLDATSRSTALRLIMDGDRIGVIDGTYLDTYSTTASVNVSHGRVPECSVSTRASSSFATASGSANAYLIDVAYCGGYIVYGHVSGQSSYLTVEDAAGNVIRPPEVVFSAGVVETTLALAVYSTYVIAIFMDGGSANVPAYYLNTASSSTLNTGWVSIGNVATDHITTGVASVALSSQSLSNRVAFAYVNNSGVDSQLTVKTVTISGVVETATVQTSPIAHNTPDCVAVEGSIADTLWVAWNDSTSVKLKGLDADSLSTAFATTTAIITLNTTAPSAIGIVSSSTAGKGRLAVTDGVANRLQMRGFQTSGGAVATDGSQITVPNCMLGSRPFRVGTRYYALFAPAPGNTSNTQGRAVLCDFTEDQSWLRPVAVAAPAGLGVFPAQFRAHIESTGSSRYVTVVAVIRTGVSRATTLVTFDFADINRWLPVQLGGTTILSGGMVSTFDGNRVAELNFVVGPPKPSASDSGGGSGPDGSYRYILVYEEVDARGNWAISDVSDPSDSVTVADNTITVSAIRPCSITARNRRQDGPEVRMVLYRTLAGGEAPYYRLKVFNNITSSITTSYSDSTADSSLSSNAKLYTAPGDTNAALARESPPGLNRLVNYGGMLVGSCGESIWYTASPVDGEEPWFSSEFQVPVQGGGDIAAIEVQDGTLYIFKRGRIYVVAGEAPSPNGALGGFGTPRRLAVDVGAAQRPTCVTSMGIWFVSDRGLELLTRAQTVDWIGEKVQDELASFPVVTSITFDPDSSCVLVECATSTSSGAVSGTGRTLVYDTRAKVWQSFDRRKNSAGTADTPAQDGAMVWNGSAWRYAWLGTDGRVYVEDHSTYLDPGSAWVTAKARTSWIKAGGLQGRQIFSRLMLLSRKLTDHNLTLQVGYNYAETFKTASSYTRSIINTLLSDGWPITQLGHDGHDDAECESVAVEVADATPTGGTVGTGKGGAWIGLTFDVTPQQGTFELTGEAR